MRAVRVVPDVSGIDKQFDYLVPESLAPAVEVGTMVRIELHGRRVGGWVVDDAVRPAADVASKLKPVAKVTGHGPAPDLIELAQWAAWRWVARPNRFLKTASPPSAVPTLPPARARRPAPQPIGRLATQVLERAGDAPCLVARMPPLGDPLSIVVALASLGNLLVIAPTVDQAYRSRTALDRAGVPVVAMPRGWAQARAGGVSVVGTRSAAFAPVVDLGAIVVLDEHDESLQEEGAPTWHAREVAIERSRRAGVPCVLISPTPSLEALEAGELVVGPRSGERARWPAVEVIDLRNEDPAAGLLTRPLTQLLRDESKSVVCVLNRKGRAQLLACAACRDLAACDRCGTAVGADDEGLRCGRCGARRPEVCLSCGATRLKRVRPGISRLRDEMSALAGTPVAEISGDASDAVASRLSIGTEALLHRAPAADVVIFLDFDQELLAPRMQAAEQAMSLIVRAGRLVGGRGADPSRRLIVQTRVPDHPVVDAARLGDPARLADHLSETRRTLALPPYAALATVSGQAASAFIERLGAPPGLSIVAYDEDWLVRASDHDTLLASLHAVDRPPGRLSIKVDPPRV